MRGFAFRHFIAELLTGHGEGSRDLTLRRPCLFLGCFALWGVIYSCRTPGQRESRGCQLSGAGGHSSRPAVGSFTGRHRCHSTELVCVQPRSAGGFTVSLKRDFWQTLWLLSVFFFCSQQDEGLFVLIFFFFFLHFYSVFVQLPGAAS